MLQKSAFSKELPDFQQNQIPEALEKKPIHNTWVEDLKIISIIHNWGASLQALQEVLSTPLLQYTRRQKKLVDSKQKPVPSVPGRNYNLEITELDLLMTTDKDSMSDLKHSAVSLDNIPKMSLPQISQATYQETASWTYY